MRKLIKTYDSCERCVSTIESLIKDYKLMFKMSPKCDLYYCQWGPEEKPKHGITAYYEEASKSDLIFFEKMLENV